MPNANIAIVSTMRISALPQLALPFTIRDVISSATAHAKPYATPTLAGSSIRDGEIEYVKKVSMSGPSRRARLIGNRLSQPIISRRGRWADR